MKRGFSLIEMLVTVSILAFCLCGILLTYMNMFTLSDLGRDLTLSTNTLQANLEDLKRSTFDCLFTSSRTSPVCPPGCLSCFYNGDTFNLSGIAEGKGRIEIETTSYADLKKIRLVGSFKSRQNLIGEDRNLNGRLDAGEDTNNNGRLDSLLEVVTLVAK